MTKSLKYQNFAVVGLSVLLVGVSIAMIQFKVPTILTTLMGMFDLTASGGSWLMSIFTLVTVFSAVLFGSLAQNFNPKVIVLAAAGLTALGSAIGAFTEIGWVLIASRGIEGLALAAISICGPIIIQQSVNPKKIGSALGIWGVWISLGTVIAGIITPMLFRQFGFTALWLEYAAFVVAATVAMLLVVHMPKESLEKTNAKSDLKPRYRELLTVNILFYMLGFIAFNICTVAVATFVPTLLQARGMDATLSGFLSTLPMLLSLISAPILGILSDKVDSPRWMLALSFAFIGPCAYLMFTQPDNIIWVAAIVMGIFGMGSSGLLVSSFLRVLSRPELIPIGMGALITVQGIGLFLSTFLTQILLGPEFLNQDLAGVVIAIIGLAGAAFFALCKMEKQRP
jgi:MFS family permease